MINPFTETALTTVSAAITADPTAVQDRSRAAALVDAGYGAVDTYARMQPFLFVASTVGLLISGMALAKRRKNPEAVALYATTAILSGVTAFLTRPDFLRPAPTPAAAATATTPAMAGALSWLDNRVAARSAQQPGWESATWNRLAADLGYSPLDPAMAMLLTANSK